MRDFNRHTGEVAFPEAGEGATLQFTVKALEALESAYGEDYIDVIVKALSKVQVKVYQTVLAATLQGGDASAMPFGMLWEQINIIILDALNLSIYGRTYDEQKAWTDEQLAKRLQGMEENPKLAAILSLMSAGKPESEPD